MGDVLFALCVEIHAGDGAFDLVEAYVIKSLKARPRDGPNAVIRHQKIFFPTHEDIFALREVLVGEVWFLG